MYKHIRHHQCGSVTGLGEQELDCILVTVASLKMGTGVNVPAVTRNPSGSQMASVPRVTEDKEATSMLPSALYRRDCEFIGL